MQCGSCESISEHPFKKLYDAGFNVTINTDNRLMSNTSMSNEVQNLVDAFNFFKDFGSQETLIDRDLTNIDGDDRTIVNLLTDQLEFANVIVLNKADLVTKDTLGILKSAIKKLNPSAQIVVTRYSNIDPKAILNTKRFNIVDGINKNWM